MKNYSKPDIVHFEITELPDFELNYDSLKLKTSINLTNMVLFTREGRLQRFEMVDDIIEYFCQVRYEYYEKRKINQLKVMKEQLEWLQNKHKFLEEIMNDTLVIHKRSEQEIVKDLVSKNYKSSNTESPCFDYLLNMNIRSMSQDKINSLQKDINNLNQNIKNLENTDESSMWINDLDKFTQQYQNRTKSKSK
jgi:DNA topoisomerase-2